MINLIEKQYELIRSSRGVVISFVEQEVGEGLNSPVPAFEGSTVRYILVHIVNTYRQWLGNFALQGKLNLYDDAEFPSIIQIRHLFDETDELVKLFLKSFGDKLDEPVTNTLSRDRQFTLTPLQLFTHVLTHEFHHKGQAMTMCRLLGYIPPDTDVVRT